MLGRLFRRSSPIAGDELGRAWRGRGRDRRRMIGAGLACIVHAIVPALFTETAGRTVIEPPRPYDQRKAGAANPKPGPTMKSDPWQVPTSPSSAAAFRGRWWRRSWRGAGSASILIEGGGRAGPRHRLFDPRSRARAQRPARAG